LTEVDAVELENMEVNVESHGGINALHRGDGARERVLDTGQTERFLCSAPERAAELGNDSSEHFCTETIPGSFSCKAA
jgi:hypothetical protein